VAAKLAPAGLPRLGSNVSSWMHISAVSHGIAGLRSHQGAVLDGGGGAECCAAAGTGGRCPAAGRRRPEVLPLMLSILKAACCHAVAVQALQCRLKCLFSLVGVRAASPACTNLACCETRCRALILHCPHTSAAEGVSTPVRYQTPGIRCQMRRVCGVRASHT
jgi:hypothetical protein